MKSNLLPAALAGALMLSGTSPVCRAQAERDAALLRNVVVVSGAGEATAPPDVAYVTLGVTTEGKRAQEAAQANAAASQKVADAIRAQGVADKDIQTSGYSLQPRYANQPNREPTITGYIVSNTVRATVRNLPKVGPIIDAALDAGANNVQGLSFGLEARQRPQQAALAEAMRDARDKATVLAGAAGMAIGPAVRIEEASFRRPVPMMAAMEMGMARAATPVAPGELTVTANVTVTYALAVRAGAAAGERSEGRRTALAAERRALMAELPKLQVRYAPQHPAVVQVKARLAEVDRELAAMPGPGAR